MPQITYMESNVTHNVSQNPIYQNGVWECGDQRFIDPDGSLYEPIIDVVPPTVDVISFKLLHTSLERITARELRATDPVIDDFWAILDDPRTENVVMALPSIQQAIEYTLTAINAAGVPIDVEARKAAILSGLIV